MKVLVVGGSGFVGSRLSRELHERGHEVTVLSRTPGDGVAGGVRTVSGDVTDYDSIEAAFAGQDAVVNLVALSPLFTPAGGDEMHERVHLDGTRHVVRAAEVHGVRKFVQLSALGADPDGPTAYIRAKGRAETVVRESSLDWVVVRPSVVFGEGGEFVSFARLLTTPYVTALPGGGKTRFQPIRVDDLAPLLADAVESDEHVGETYELGGPEVLTLAAVTELIYEADGKPVAVLSLPMGLARVGLAVGGAIPGFPMGPDQYRSLRFDNTVAENDVRAFGVDPDDLGTLGDYLSASEGGASSAESPRSALRARSTFALFAFLALGWLLPDVVDVYSFGGLPLVFVVPSYLVTLFVYDAPWGLENVVYAIDPVVPGGGAALWDGGLLVTFYLFAAASTWLGRRLQTAARSLTGESGDGGTRAP